MATQSIPPNLTDDKPNQNQDSEPVESITEEKKVVLGEHARQTSPGSIFVNSEPIREEQVQNAVKFLSHPKVRGSPVKYRRSFLEKKGLTKEEIDEAFLRVPDPAPSVTTTQGNNRNQDRQVEAATNMQQKVSTQASQPVVARPTGIVSTKMILRPARFHWSHAFLAIGSLVAWGTGTALLFKKVFVHRLKSWICKVVLGEENGSIKKRDPKPCLAEEVVAAAKAAAEATTDMARASQNMMNSKFEERRYLESFRNVLNVQVDEMKSMSKTIRKLEVMNSPSASVEPAGSSYPEPNKIMAMIQRGEKPPGFEKINHFPLNSNQLTSNPRLAPQLQQPWEISQGQNGSSSKAQDAGPWWQQKTAWVPPQPPPIAMPEAAAAIRQPKSVIQREQTEAGNHPISHPPSDIAELQRITKISESGGEIEMNQVNTATEVNETQEEQ